MSWRLKMTHLFWHFVAMFAVCDFSTTEVSNEEHKKYIAFMKKHGFNRAP
jgi:hypothetical protein